MSGEEGTLPEDCAVVTATNEILLWLGSVPEYHAKLNANHQRPAGQPGTGRCEQQFLARSKGIGAVSNRQ